MDKTGSEWIFGRHAVSETMIANRRHLRRLLVSRGSTTQRRIRKIDALGQKRGVDIEIVPRDRLDELQSGNHQGVLLQVTNYPYAPQLNLGEIAGRNGVVLALDSLNDPKNVGTLLRTAEAIKVDGIVLPVDRSARITPAVVNASAGATEHLDIVQVTNLVRWLNQAKRAGFWIAGLASGPKAHNLFDVETPLPLVLVVGAEGSGMRRLVREQCDLLLALPMYGRIASLNAAVAGSIALYEIREFTAIE